MREEDILKYQKQQQNGVTFLITELGRKKLRVLICRLLPPPSRVLGMVKSTEMPGGGSKVTDENQKVQS